MVKHSENTS